MIYDNRDTTIKQPTQTIISMNKNYLQFLATTSLIWHCLMSKLKFSRFYPYKTVLNSRLACMYSL